MNLSADESAEPPFSIYSQHSEVYHELHHREIRLIRLLKGRWHDKIQCQLFQTPLANNPTYKALSYAWGSPRATRPIVVNQVNHSVTVNLESALRRLRKPDENLIIWVDALCINQYNNPERTEQVSLMYDIFSSTEEVIVYLGEVPHLSSLAPRKPVFSATTVFHCDDNDEDKIEAFRQRCTASSGARTRMDHALDVFCFLRLLSGDPSLSHFPPFELGSFADSVYQRNLFESLRQLMLCRWWNRIWVIQEVVVPGKVTMVYGSATAPWEMLVNAAFWDSRNQSSLTPLSFPHEYSSVLEYFSRIILDIDRMRELWRSKQKSDLLPLLRRFSGRKASDDRDKVFALLGLARDQTSIIPDYSLSVPQVFRNVVLDIFRRTKSLTALAGDLGRKDRRDLPSWVPDWTAAYDDFDRRRADNAGEYNTTGGCRVYVSMEGQALSLFEYVKEKWGIQVEAPQIAIWDSHDKRDIFSKMLKAKEWMKWLPDGASGEDITEKMCLAALDSYYTANGSVVSLQVYGETCLKAKAMCIDEVVLTGETAYSEESLWSVVQSWAVLINQYFLNKDYDRSSLGLGDAFRRLLCGNRVRHELDAVGRLRGIAELDDDDHARIAAWFFQGGNISPHGDTVSSMTEAAIRAAAVRRTFFITKRGYLGLGPAKMRSGDKVVILLGGSTPFILRDVGRGVVPGTHGQKRDRFEMVGDTYVHGLMDGEAMDEWKKLADSVLERNTKTNTHGMQQALAAYEYAESMRRAVVGTLSLWEDTATLGMGGLVMNKVEEIANKYDNIYNRRPAAEFKAMIAAETEEPMETVYRFVSKDGRDEEVHINDMSLKIWKEQLDQAKGIESVVRLTMLARLKIRNHKTKFRYWRMEAVQKERELKRFEISFEEHGSLYLV